MTFPLAVREAGVLIHLSPCVTAPNDAQVQEVDVVAAFPVRTIPPGVVIVMTNVPVLFK